MKLACAALLALAACASSAVEAQHRGAQVRLLVGPAYVDASQDLDTDEAIGAAGLGYAVQLAIGVPVTGALALNTELAYARSDAAEHEVLGQTSVTALFVGLGATYWLRPADVYLAGSLGATRSSIEGAPIRVQVEVPQNDASEVGYGAQLSAGKVFRLAGRLGAGAALSLGWASASNPVSGVDSHREVWTALLALAATIG